MGIWVFLFLYHASRAWAVRAWAVRALRSNVGVYQLRQYPAFVREFATEFGELDPLALELDLDHLKVESIAELEDGTESLIIQGHDLGAFGAAYWASLWFIGLPDYQVTR